MNTIKNYWFAALVIICFLCIQISYNNTPSHSIFVAFIALLNETIDKGIDLSTHNFSMNFTYTLIEFLIVSLTLLISSLFENKKIITVGLLLFIFLWCFWIYMYEPYIEINIFILSSIPFFISLVLMMWHLTLTKRNRL